MDAFLSTVENYAKSDYHVDTKDQKFFSSYGMLGRVTSLLDIPSQVAKAVVVPLALAVSGVALVALGLVNYILGAGSSLISQGCLLAKNEDDTHTYADWAKGSFELGNTYAKTGLTVLAIGPVVMGTAHLVTAAADTVGIIVPEVGMYARCITRYLREDTFRKECDINRHLRMMSP